MKRRFPAKLRGPCVYFAEAVGLDRIKIGHTTDLTNRLANLRTACPVPLHLLFAFEAPLAAERDLHAMFARYRIANEWFHASVCLREAIASMELRQLCASSPALGRLGVHEGIHEVMVEHGCFP